jgi:5-bromo-4-chloroindolyl phosphate hydrolysis protein
MQGKKGDLLNAIIPGVIGGGIFIVFLLVGLNFFISLGIGVAGFVAASLVFASKKKEVEFIVEGISLEKYNEILAQGQEKLKILGSFIARVKDVEVKKKIKEINDVVEKIFADI